MLEVYYRIDINLISMVLLGIVIFIAYRRLDRKDKLNEIFLENSIVIFLQLFVEAASCVVNSRRDSWLIPVAVFLHLCLFTLGPLLSYLWCCFVYRWVIPEDAVQNRVLSALTIPIAINFVITLLSPFYGYVFSISSMNVYQRGPWFIFAAAIIYLYLGYGLYIVIRNRERIIKEEFLPLLICGTFPMIGGLVQTLFYGVLLMWSSAAFSLIIIYIFLQQRMVQLDSLTGAWTRGSFDQYITQRINRKSNSAFGVIFIDLDKLKRINDRFGHIAGDHAIKKTVELIKSSLRKTDVVARYGGDEFVIVVDCTSREELARITEKIDSRFSAYNKTSGKEYVLEYSCGIEIYDSSFDSVEHFLNHVDNIMYVSKGRKKSPILPAE